MEPAEPAFALKLALELALASGNIPCG